MTTRFAPAHESSKHLAVVLFRERLLLGEKQRRGEATAAACAVPEREGAAAVVYGVVSSVSSSTNLVNLEWDPSQRRRQGTNGKRAHGSYSERGPFVVFTAKAELPVYSDVIHLSFSRLLYGPQVCHCDFFFVPFLLSHNPLYVVFYTFLTEKKKKKGMEIIFNLFNKRVRTYLKYLRRERNKCRS